LIVAYELQGELLMWLIGGVVCLPATPRVQLLLGWPHIALRYH